MAKMQLNRLKVVLAEKEVKNKQLAEALEKDESTISQWCTNARQPSLENLLRIANVLDIDIRELLNSSKEVS